MCGWIRIVGGLRRTRGGGIERKGLGGYPVATDADLVCMAKLSTTGTAIPEQAPVV